MLARSLMSILLLVGLLLSPVSAAFAAQPGTLTIGVHVTLVSRWLDPGETEALITPCEDLKVKEGERA